MMLERRSMSFPITVLVLALLPVLLLSILWFGVYDNDENGLELLYKSGFILAVLACCLSFYFFRKDLTWHPEKVFLVVLLSLTCFSSWSFDTNEVLWDLESHYRFALEFSDVDREYEPNMADLSIIDRDIKADDDRTSVLEESLSEEGNAIVFASIVIWTDTQSLRIKDDLLNEISNRGNAGDQVFIGRVSSSYNRIASLPASMVLFITSILNLPFAARFVLAKLSYALIYSFVMYFGMKRLRSGKTIFAVIALYPTAIFLAANYGYDYWVNCWTMYSVAYIVGILQRPGRMVKRADAFKMLGAFLVGLGPKAIYFPLVLFCLFIPKTRFASRKTWLTFRGAALLCMFIVMASFGLPFLLSSGSNVTDLRGESGVDSLGQVKFILSDLPGYLGILAHNIFDYLSIPATKQYIAHLAYLGMGSDFVWICFLLAGIFAAITDTRCSSKAINNYKSRIATMLIVVCGLALAATALYVSFTAVGSDRVSGFQGRYIMPLLFPFFIFMGSKKLFWPRNKRGIAIYNGLILGALAALDFYQVWVSYTGLLH